MSGVTDPVSSADVPSHVRLYGNDHSPWAQGVILGLHERGIDHMLVTVPPFAVLRESGVLMPAASLDGGPWMLDSEAILVAVGFSQVTREERHALEAVFASAALDRTDPAFRFWHRFSWARDERPTLPGRLWNHFWRAFSIFYFFTLISLARQRVPRPTLDARQEQFTALQRRLAPDADFFGGDAPDTVDFQLFGLVQMCASLPGPSLEVLQRAPELARLRRWAEAMQRRFAHHDHLYTARSFEPLCPAIARSTALERAAFWLGAVTMWLAWPITLPTTLFFVRQVRKKGLVR